jgi:hypothetical protein
MANTKGLQNDLVEFYKELQLAVPSATITSGLRSKPMGTAGLKSHHLSGGAIDLAADPDIGAFLKSPLGNQLLVKHKLGLIDETDPDALAKTGGTGAHYHIGKDSKAVAAAKNAKQPTPSERSDAESAIASAEQQRRVQEQSVALAREAEQIQQEQASAIFNNEIAAQQAQAESSAKMRESDIETMLADAFKYEDVFKPVDKLPTKYDKQLAQLIDTPFQTTTDLA